MIRLQRLSFQSAVLLCVCDHCLLCCSGAGADFVMMGGMLAGHDQCTGQLIEKDGKKYKLFYGMSSDTAMKKYAGGVAEYRWEVNMKGLLKMISVTFSNSLCSFFGSQGI